MNNDFLKTIGLMIVIAIVVYVSFSMMNKYLPSMKDKFNSIEGLTTLKEGLGTSSNGVAGNATTYAKKLETHTTKMIDSMLIPKYRSDYEQILLHLENFHNASLLNKFLNYNLSDPNKSNEELSKLVKHHDSVVQSLNNAMKFLDSQ
jgi:hypothetical protein